MGRKVMAWIVTTLVALFNFLTTAARMDTPQPPQKLEQPRLERRDDTLRPHVLMPEEGPHTHPPALPPPPKIPFINYQAMLEGANQAVFSRARALRTATYQAIYASPVIAG